MIAIGTSGYVYQDWKGKFYPPGLLQKEWLAYYAQFFQTVEINATFYGSFTPEQIRRWYDVTPKEFLFSIKGSRFITHVKRLQVTDVDIALFFDQLAPLGSKLSCVLWQLSGNFRYSQENFAVLEAFLKLLPSVVRECIEFRDSSWFVDPVWQLLQKYHIGFVESQTSEFPIFEKITAEFAYLRFHGPTKLYASKYTEKELGVFAKKAQELSKVHDVYCYFNNDAKAYAIDNAQTLTRLTQQGRDQTVSAHSP